jgi:peptidoglycan/LPS O-acetylase OafA/YrhL
VSHSVPEKNYIPSLDGLRAASIAIVFLAHAGVSNMIPGGFGVTVFFFLSGYLITSLLVAEYDTYRSVSIKAFYLRRVIRLGPPLLITLIFASFLVLIGVAEGDLSPGAIFSQLFFYYNYYSLYVENAGDGVSGLAILWSLAVEEHFYLVFPWIFLLLAAGRIRVRTLSVFLVLVLIWRMVRFYGFGDSEWKIYISTDTRIDSILYGCMLALLVGSKKASDWFPSRFMYPMLAAAFVVLMISFVVRDPAFRSTIRYSLQGLALMPIFYFATSKHELWLFRPLNWKPVRRIGQYSYTIYLVHFVIINAMVFQSVLPDNKLLFTALAAAISIAFAALVFELAEKPLKPLRQRLSGH